MLTAAFIFLTIGGSMAQPGLNPAAILYASEQETGASTDLTIDASCAGMLGTALQVGARATGTRAPGASVNVHASPETASTVFLQVPPASAFNLVGGPACTAEHRWWHADFGSGIYGWIADGDSSTRWLEPQ